MKRRQDDHIAIDKNSGQIWLTEQSMQNKQPTIKKLSSVNISKCK